MLSINPNELSTREMYHLLTGSIIPRPIAFVTTLSKEGVLNGAPFSYFNIVSAHPPLLSISVQRMNGKMKHTATNAIDRKEFVVHITDESYVEQMNATSATVPEDVSEVELAQLTRIQSNKISVPAIQEASIRFECTLEKVIPLGENEDAIPSCELLIGRIVHVHIKDELYKDGKIDQHALHPVSRLAGRYYSTVGNIFGLKRPR